MLVRDGTVLPQIKPAQSTMQMDWSKLDLVVYAKNSLTAKGLVCLPADNVLHELVLNKTGGGFKLANDPLAGQVTWNHSPGGEGRVIGKTDSDVSWQTNFHPAPSCWSCSACAERGPGPRRCLPNPTPGAMSSSAAADLSPASSLIPVKGI